MVYVREFEEAEELSLRDQALSHHRRTMNLLFCMHDMINEGRLPHLDLWRFYWLQSDRVKYLATRHFLCRDASLIKGVPLAIIDKVATQVPYPCIRAFLMAHGWSILRKVGQLERHLQCELISIYI